MAAELTAHNLPPIGGNAIAVFVILGFVLGLVLVWLYAAIRPRFGPGPEDSRDRGWFGLVPGLLLGAVGFGALGLFPTSFSSSASYGDSSSSSWPPLSADGYTRRRDALNEPARRAQGAVICLHPVGGRGGHEAVRIDPDWNRLARVTRIGRSAIRTVS